MGREVRRVPADWEHPRDERGNYRPLYDESFREAATRWKREFMAWEAGERPDHCGDESSAREFWEWDGGPPDREYYRPEWTDEERTHFQMYETVSEGTPISPPMPDEESLARWLAESCANAGAGRTATYEQWLRTVKAGYAPSLVFGPSTGLISGVEATTESDHA